MINSTKKILKAAKKSLILVTGNKDKLIEFQQILSDKYEIDAQNIDLPELQGDCEEIAKQKALLAFKEGCFVEDTSLCFNAYKGLPGPYIKWFLKKLTIQGVPKMLDGFEDKTAYAQCIISYMDENLKEPLLFIGKTPGTIVQPRGPKDSFGWDPIFQPEGHDKTYAEMTKAEKNVISHRFRAIEDMKKQLN